METIFVPLALAFGTGAPGAVAGGGTFLTLPSFILAGIPPLSEHNSSSLYGR